MTESLRNLRVEELLSAAYVNAKLEREYANIAAFRKDGSLITNRINEVSNNQKCIEKVIYLDDVDGVEYLKISGSREMILKIENIVNQMVK